MKKQQILKGISAIIIVGNMCIYKVSAQTQGSGSITNTNGAGTSGTNRCFIGDNAGNSNTGSNNSIFGHSAGKLNDSGGNNSFFGYQSGYSNAAHTYGGHDHVFVGYQAGYNSGNGDSEGTSAQNTFVGSGCGYSNVNGGNNTFLGFKSGYSGLASGYNTYTGAYSGYYNSNGTQNTIVGYEAGYGSAATFHYNNFFGYKAGHSITTGGDNVFSGHSAGYTNTTGAYNTFSGNSSGYSNSTGSNNVFTGFKAGYSNTTASDNNFSGYFAGYSNTTGYNNIAIGSSANYANSTSSHNVAIGVLALRYNTGAANIAMGTTALYNNTSGTLNMAIGFQALYDNTTGSSNTAAGYLAMQNVTTGSNNTGYGRNALGSSTDSDNNTASGMNALSANTTGDNNTALGYSAGSANTTGYNNTFVGYSANASNVGLNNATAIGNGATTTATNMMYFGNVNAVLYSNTGVLNASDGRFKTNVAENVKGLEFVKKLRPVTYTMNTEALDDFLIQNMPDSIKTAHKTGMDFTASSAVIHSGFIAQEVEQAAQQVNFNSSIVHAPDNESSHYAVNYAEFVVPLVKAVQELSKTADSLQAKTQSQDSINAAKDAQLQTMQNQLDQLAAALNSCCTAGTTKSMQLNNSQSSNTKEVELSNKNSVVLDQNVPNPFAEQTVINYYLPDNVSRAQIIFLDQSGKLIKAVDLTEKGKGQLNVFANDLSNGMYTYSLIVDGKTVETKKMVKQ